uniref:UPF0586 protein C9orf41 homolog isoform X2 n=2 Tax=Rhizophora mucronata TaxID=61149 RepID=A0A2P2MEA2_RHIMU
MIKQGSQIYPHSSHFQNPRYNLYVFNNIMGCINKKTCHNCIPNSYLAWVTIHFSKVTTTHGETFSNPCTGWMYVRYRHWMKLVTI